MTAESGPRPSTSEMRWFGLILAAVFAVLGGVIAWQTGTRRVSNVLWGIGASLAVLYYAVPALRWPMYAGWMRLVTPFGLLVSTVILGIIYFGIITPIGRMTALFGRDALGRRLDPERASYWVPHPPVGESGRYLRQS
jgi:hypothetical protein